MTKPTAWSYSSLSLFQQCPYKYYRLRIEKDIKEPESEAMAFGNAVHKSAELAIKKGTPIPREHSFMEPYVAPILKLDGTKEAELRLGLTAKFKPCGFFDRDVWWRGIADVVVVNGAKALSLDWKTGNAKYPDVKQLEMVAIGLFYTYPEVQEVTGGLAFVVHKKTVPYTLKRDQVPDKLPYWLGETERLDKAVALDKWVKRPNFTCKGWCPVEDCPYWEPKRRRR